MRLWSIHPKYLDQKGLVALWREALLAKKVLKGKTKGYKNHPQLIRFKKAKDSLGAINFYLSVVWQESKKRDYSFNKSKINFNRETEKIKINNDQLYYEFDHLLKKLKKRDYKKYKVIKNPKAIIPHPIFKVVDGKIEDWEKL